MKTCNAWPADYTKKILGNELEIARTIFTQENVVGINCVIIWAPIARGVINSAACYAEKPQLGASGGKQ